MTPKKSVLHLAIPEKIKEILYILERNVHQAYVVGGCVRDGLLCRVPKDWDVATSARPEEVKNFFFFSKMPDIRFWRQGFNMGLSP